MEMERQRERERERKKKNKNDPLTQHSKARAEALQPLTHTQARYLQDVGWFAGFGSPPPTP